MGYFSKNRVIVVLGMHRSGTSAMTRGLVALGVELGDDLLPPHEDNMKGYWEDKGVREFNDELLAALGSRWDSVSHIPEKMFSCAELGPFYERAGRMLKGKFRGKSLFAIKDPRICRLMPFWARVFDELDLDVSCLIPVRHPMSVVSSLMKRGGFVKATGYCLWLEYVICAMEFSQRMRRVTVGFDQFLKQPVEEMNRIATLLELPEEERESECEDFISSFLDKNLCHSRHGTVDFSDEPLMFSEVVETYAFLNSLCCGETDVSSEECAAFFTGMRQRVEALQPLIRSVDAVRNELEIRGADEVSEILSSASWRITTPLRSIAGFVKR